MEFTLSNAQINTGLLYRVVYGHHPKICQYYLKHPCGSEFLRKLTEDELLFLMRNNAKKRLGVPMTRVAKRGRKKQIYVNKRRRAICRYRVFDIVEREVTRQLQIYYDTQRQGM